MWGLASAEGSTPIRAEPRSFLEAFRRRIDGGLLSGRPHPRSRYIVTRSDGDALQFRAANWSTAVSVGLNEVTLAVSSKDRVSYAIRYPRWARFVVALSAVLAIALILSLLAFGDLARQSGGFSPQQSLGMAWAIALLMDRIIAEVDAEAFHAATRASHTA